MTTDMTKEEIELITNVMPEVKITPANMPSLAQLDKWQKMVGQWFWKFDTAKNEVRKGLYAEPINMFPQYVDGAVTYRFNIRFHFGAVLDEDRQPLRDKLGDTIVRIAGRPDSETGLDQLIDCKKFEQDYKPAS